MLNKMYRCRIFVDILTREKMSQFSLLLWNLFFGQFFDPVGGDGEEGGIVILAHCKFHFSREHENLA